MKYSVPFIGHRKKVGKTNEYRVYGEKERGTSSVYIKIEQYE